MTAVGAAAASCAQPTAEVVEKQVVQTVVVEKQVEKVVTATPVVSKYNESPQLAGLVAQGKLPPIEERLPSEPMVIPVTEEIGEYGGTWHRLATSANDAGIYQNRLAYENLVRWNLDGSDMYANVCTSWEVGPEGKQFTFNLRPGMKWSDGAPFTANDIVWKVNTVWQNKEAVPNFPSAWAPGGVPMVAEALDDYTLRFTFGVPYGLCMLRLASSWGATFNDTPMHYRKQFHIDAVEDKAALQKMATDAGHEQWYQLYNDKGNRMNNAEIPVIFPWGPNVLPPKSPISLKRNPYYWKVDPEGNQLPYIDAVEFVIVEGGDVLNLRAASGEVDMQLRQITMANYPIFKDSEEKGDYRTMLWGQGFATDTALHCNTLAKDPAVAELLDDKRFRYALSLGINRDEIIQAVWLGTTFPSQVSPLASSPHYWDEYAKNMIEYDPDRANAYLDEMGLTERDGEGYRLRKDGQRVGFVYEYATTTFGDWRATGELLTAHWKDLGVELIMKEEARQLWSQRVAAGEHEMTVWVGSAEFNPLIDPRHFFPFATGSSYMAPAYSDWFQSDGKEGTEPPAGSDFHKQMDLFNEIKVTVDTEKQKQLFRQIMEIAKENLWVIGISSIPQQPVIVKNNFRNVPEDGISDWHLQSPGNTLVEQYFIKQS